MKHSSNVLKLRKKNCENWKIIKTIAFFNVNSANYLALTRYMRWIFIFIKSKQNIQQSKILCGLNIIFLGLICQHRKYDSSKLEQLTLHIIKETSQNSFVQNIINLTIKTVCLIIYDKVNEGVRSTRINTL